MFTKGTISSEIPGVLAAIEGGLGASSIALVQWYVLADVVLSNAIHTALAFLGTATTVSTSLVF